MNKNFLNTDIQSADDKSEKESSKPVTEKHQGNSSVEANSPPKSKEEPKPVEKPAAPETKTVESTQPKISGGHQVNQLMYLAGLMKFEVI